jgi:hypothetical protein
MMLVGGKHLATSEAKAIGRKQVAKNQFNKKLNSTYIPKSEQGY